jgi:hypothetical protein
MLNPDFIIWSGDTPGHHITQTYHGNLDIILRTSYLIKERFPKTPVFPAFGNHDSWPVDQFPLPDYNPMLRDVSACWSSLWNLTMKDGYYTVPVPVPAPAGSNPPAEPIKLVVLSTTWWDKNNLFVNHSHLNVVNQSVWADSLEITDRTWLMGHIFPTAAEGISVYSSWALRWIQKHAPLETIWGHSHKDMVLLFCNITDDPAGPRNTSGPLRTGYISPSVTTSGHHPAVRLFRYNVTSGRIVGYTQYRFNIYKNLTMEKVYMMPDDYGMKDMSASEWDRILLTALADPGGEIGTRYWSNYWVGSPPTEPCLHACMYELLQDSYAPCSKLQSPQAPST